MTKHVLFTLLLALCASQAMAQTVYKCTASGQTSYGEAPCAAGSTQQMLETPKAPQPAAASAGRSDSGAQLRQQADSLTRQRHQREAKEDQLQLRADKQAARQRERCASLKLHQQWAVEDAARDKNASKANLKVRRAAEQLAIACPR